VLGRVKRVAILAPDFVPSGLPPALRIRYFASHLREFGYEPIIITTDPRTYDWPYDTENYNLFPPEVRVIRTGAFSAARTRLIGFGDIGMRSLPFTWQALRALCRREKIDLVFISVSPFVTSLLGRAARAQFGVPYVVDYIDPWRTDFYLSVPVSARPGGRKWLLAHWMARLLEPVALRHVAHLTAVSQGTIDGIVRQFDWLTDVETTVIPYGGEPADLDYVRSHPRQSVLFDPDDGFVHLSYLGTVSAGMHGPLRAFFAAVWHGLQSHPEEFRRLRLHFAGTTYATENPQLQVLPIAAEYGVAEIVHEHPARLAYLDTLQVLLDSHGLMVVGSDEPHYTASKIFPYILSKRPLLAFFHEASSVVDIVRATRSGEVITFGPGRPLIAERDRIVEALLRLASYPRDYLPPTCWEVFDQYTVRAMAARLAGAFDRVLAAEDAL
jgi:hypothetical protein